MCTMFYIKNILSYLIFGFQQCGHVFRISHALLQLYRSGILSIVGLIRLSPFVTPWISLLHLLQLRNSKNK